MDLVPIGEPVQVLAAFSGGGVEPLRFRWHGQPYEIDAVNGKWTDRGAGGLALHFSVQVGLETYYLHFASSETQWWLDQVIVE